MMGTPPLPPPTDLLGLGARRHAQEKGGPPWDTVRRQSGTGRTGKSEPGGSRTHDLRIKSPLLSQLSYRLSRYIH
jgi:hypothetical protein